MRLLIWAAFYPPHVGGYERNVHELARRLAEKGHQVTVATCAVGPGARDIETMDGVAVWRVPCWRALNELYPIPKPSRMLWMLLRARFDVVNTQTRFFVTSLLGAVCACWHHVPYIHTERGTSHPVEGSWLVRLLGRVYDHTLGSWTVSGASRVVGVSAAACAFACHIGAKKACRVPNGVNCCTVAREPSSPPVVFFAGRLVRAKGVQDLIEASRMVATPHRLVIAGDGPYRGTLQKQANGDAEFVGVLVGEDLQRQYARAVVFVNPSYTEGLPTTVIEAVAAGVPVVTTNVGGAWEAMGRSGVLVAPGDIAGMARWIERMLTDPPSARDCLANAQFAVADYSWDVVAAEYDRVLRILCRG